MLRKARIDAPGALLCYWLHRKLAMTATEIGRRLKIGQPAARRLSRRGEQIEKELGLHLIDRKGLKAWTSRTLALKNQGYHLEHNFGHGQQNLAMIFFVLNLLAFYVHQILELTDPLYQKVRYSNSTSRMEYWNQCVPSVKVRNLIFFCSSSSA